MDPLRDSTRRRDRQMLLAIGLIALGFIVIGLAWFGSARRNEIEQQFPYLLSGGVTGLGFVAVGAAIGAVQAFGRQQDVIVEQLHAIRDSVAGRTATEPGADRHLVVAGASSYHEPGCRLIGRRAHETMDVHEAAARGLEPCRVCEPPSVAA